MRKLIGWLKFAAFMTIIGTAGMVLFLQEWGKNRDEIDNVAREKGLELPLQEPRILVDCGKKTLTLFDGDVALKRWDVALGRNQQNGVIWKGSGSTPLGEFRIIEKHERESVMSRGTRYLRINFPDVDALDQAWMRDRIDDETYEKWEDLIEKGEPLPPNPVFDEAVGIQGNWFHVRGFNVAGDGSISMRNSDVNELFEYVTVGTPVTIR
ncbi:MAG: L,D-transpeptidase [Planctomycetota bacterium]